MHRLSHFFAGVARHWLCMCLVLCALLSWVLALPATLAIFGATLSLGRLCLLFGHGQQSCTLSRYRVKSVVSRGIHDPLSFISGSAWLSGCCLRDISALSVPLCALLFVWLQDRFLVRLRDRLRVDNPPEVDGFVSALMSKVLCRQSPATLGLTSGSTSGGRLT